MDAREIASAPADGTLLRRFVESGDEKAFALLIERHGGLVLGVACRSLQNRSEAEEAAQRVFITFARKAPDLLGAPSVAAWLHRAATLESLKLRREHRRRHERIEAMNAKRIPDPEAAPADEWSGKLDEAMDKLGSKEREVLVMHFLEGRSFVEIARDLKLSADAVRKRSERALARLAQLLGRPGATGTAALTALLALQKTEAISPALAKAWAAHSLASCAAPAASSSFLTQTLLVMKTGKTGFIAVVLLAAALPIGLQAARSAILASGTAPASSGIATGPAKLPAGPNKAAAVHLTEAQLADAFRRVEAGEEPAPGAQLVLHRLVFTLDPAELKIARELLSSVKKHERFLDIAQAIYARWAEFEPRAATEAALAVAQLPQPPGSYPLCGAFGTWADAEPEAALAWLAEAGKQQVQGPHTLHYLAYQWTKRLLSERDPEAAFRLADEIGAALPAWSEDVKLKLRASWTEIDPAASQAWLENSLQGRSPVERAEAWFDWTKAAREANPLAALDAASRIEESVNRETAILNLVLNWGREFPDVLHAYISQPGILEAWEGNLASNVGGVLARSRVNETIRLADRITPGPHRDQFLDTILRSVRYVEPSQLAPAARDLSDDYLTETKTEGFDSFIAAWAKRDRAAAEQWVTTLPEGTRKARAGMILSNPKPAMEGGKP